MEGSSNGKPLAERRNEEVRHLVAVSGENIAILDCVDIPRRKFTVVGSEPHGFDGDGDGFGCEVQVVLAATARVSS